MHYCGLDLGSRKTQVCIITDDDTTVLNTSVASDIHSVWAVMKPYADDIQAVAESTFNWDWLIDGLQERQVPVPLAHTLGLFAISRAKVKTDKRDARTLARLLRSDLIPEAGICPKDVRILRDVLRRRWSLVAQRGQLYAAIRHQLYRQGRWKHTLAEIKKLSPEDAHWVHAEPSMQALARQQLENIVLLTMHVD